MVKKSENIINGEVLKKNNENLIWDFNNWDVWGEKQKFFQTITRSQKTKLNAHQKIFL